MVRISEERKNQIREAQSIVKTTVNPSKRGACAYRIAVFIDLLEGCTYTELQICYRGLDPDQYDHINHRGGSIMHWVAYLSERRKRSYKSTLGDFAVEKVNRKYQLV